MDVRDHRQAHFVFHPGQDFQARFQTGTAVRGQGGAVGFIKGGLEDQGQAKFGGIVFQGAGDGQGKLGGLDDARPGDHHQVAGSYPKIGDLHFVRQFYHFNESRLFVILSGAKDLQYPRREILHSLRCVQNDKLK